MFKFKVNSSCSNSRSTHHVQILGQSFDKTKKKKPKNILNNLKEKSCYSRSEFLILQGNQSTGQGRKVTGNLFHLTSDLSDAVNTV